MDDAEPVGLAEAFCDLTGDRHGRGDCQCPRPPYQALEIFSADILHGNEESAVLFTQIVGPADAFMGDLPGCLDLVPEALDRSLFGRDLGPDELEGDLLANLLIEGPVDRPIPPWPRASMIS
jgi:hypothetical protein